MYDFRESLKIGKAGEDKLSRIFQRAGLETEPGDGRVFDLLFSYNSCTYSIEVKHDIYQATSGNIALEYWNSKQNKPSGILASTSDFWAYVLKDSVWLITRLKLLDFFKKEKPFRLLDKAGDKNASLHLYKDVHFLSAFTQINLEPEKITKVIEEYHVWKDKEQDQGTDRVLHGF